MKTCIIIPTYNRCKILRKTLKALLDQTANPKTYEIIVVDDGSTDKTHRTVQEISKKAERKITYLRQKNKGQGSARNLGIKSAEGEIIIFIGDDIIVKPDFIKQHILTHQKHPERNTACLGFITWHPNLKITPLMKWLESGSSILGRFGGHQFAYDKLENKKEANYNFFYTSNISLKKKILEKEKFDQEFDRYGWEDIELGYRLTKKENLKIYYNKKAIGHHYHKMTLNDLKERMQLIGKSAHIIQRKHPELKKVPPIWKKIIFHILSNPLSLILLRRIKKLESLYFYALSKRYFLKGVNNRSK